MAQPPFDYLGAEHWSALGPCPVLLCDLANPDLTSSDLPDGAVDAVVIGVDRARALPVVDIARFDMLLTTVSDAPAPWVSVPPAVIDQHGATLADAVRAHPVAATLLVHVLRMGAPLATDAALTLESLAYSTLLGGGEFANWLARSSGMARNSAGEVVQERTGDVLRITLASPATRNAMTARMRDTLFEALANALDDPTMPSVEIYGQGACFSTGGDLGEFGSATDLALAHVVRSRRSVARLMLALGARASVHFHGACVGSGLEAFAGAGRRTASPNSWFHLPELSMGLMPGAGGTVTVTRAIGRHRAAWMMLSGKRVRAERAREWGLIDEIYG